MSVFYLYLVFICAMVTSQDIQKKNKIHVLFSTVKSDLELILADPDNPSTVNIEYTKEAVLHVSLHNQHYKPNSEGPHEKYIEIDGTLQIKTIDDVKEERNNVVFMDGKFVQHYNGYTHLLFTSEMEKTTYLVIKRSSHDQPKPADKTISYYSTSEFRKELISKIREMKQKRIQNEDEVKDCICLGSFSVPLTYEYKNEFLHLKKPLKGISLSENKVQSDIMHDVCYRSGRRRLSSSSRSFEGIDAVRVYDEWYQLQDEATSPETPLPEEGEEIRKKVFEIDMNNAYERLHNDNFRYKNVFLLYGSNIVLEVWGRDDGQRKYIEAKGTTMADARGRGRTNVNAFYDLHQFKYSDKLEHGSDFVPRTTAEGSYFVMYTAVEKLESHIKAVWAVMQRACDTKKQVYHFTIFYGKSIKVNYNCYTKNIEMEENHKFKMLAESKSAGIILHQCNHLRYMSHTSHFEIQCRDVMAKPIAIRQQPRQLWLNDGNPELMSATLLTAELTLLKDILITNRNSESNKPTKGVSTLDGHVLFKMQLPKNGKNPPLVEVDAGFQVKSNSRYLSYNQLKFDGAQFTDVEGTCSIKLKNTFTSPQYDYHDYPEDMYVIGSAFWTTKRLQETLKLASESATIRCAGTKNKSYSVKLVHLNLFALVGLYECSKQVFLFKGNFKALILSKTDQNVEILTERQITNFIYVVRDNFFIAGTESFDDVYAIKLPAMSTDLKEAMKNYGSPQKIQLQNTLFMLQSQELPSRKMTLHVACIC